MSVKITVNLPKNSKTLTQAEVMASPEVKAAFRVAASRYGAAMLRRFNDNSRGGGDGTWPALALSTVKARRKGGAGGVAFGGGRSEKGKTLGRGAASSLARGKKGKLVSAGGRFSVLTDTGQLRNGLVIGSVGNAVGEIKNGIRFGFSDAGHAPKAVTTEDVEVKGKTKREKELAKKRLALGVRITKKKSKTGRKLTNALADFHAGDGGGTLGTLSIARLATIHHRGNAKKGLPARPILVAPPPDVTQSISNGLVNAVRAVYRRNAR